MLLLQDISDLEMFKIAEMTFQVKQGHWQWR